MAIRARENLISAWAFTLGIIISVIVGIFVQAGIDAIVFSILFILGLIVGFFVAEKDVSTFLLASVSLVIVCFAGLQGLARAPLVGVDISDIVKSTLGSLMTLFIPATIIVAIKTVFSISKS